MPTLKSQTLSFFVHLSVLGVLLLWNARVWLQPTLTSVVNRPTRLVFIPPPRTLTPGVRAGGANRNEEQPRKGAPPLRMDRLFAPPQVHKNPALELPVSLNIDVPAVLAASDVGDPLGKLGTNSLGSGGVGGIGNFSCCGGVGDHDGGPGIDGRGVAHQFTAPKLIYKVEPEFSEDARKSKYQGMVVLSIEIDEKGHTSRFKVVSGPGLGLEQKAMEAVARWRFRPALRDGKPVATTARVELYFHLL